MSIPKLGKFVQTPDEKKRYTFDYTAWLSDGETVVSATTEVMPATTPPLVMDSLAHDNSLVTFEVSGGLVGSSYVALVQILTSTAEIKEDAISMKIIDFTV